MEHEAMCYEGIENDRVQCNLCAHRCAIAPGKFGFCGVRQNKDGTLFSRVYGEAIASHVDPIEKKPLYHFLPGARAFSIATIGCNFHCSFCQNWQISQRSKRDGDPFAAKHLLPDDVVARAVKNNCDTIAYTYTEPTIFFEYAYDSAKLAHEKGLANIFVTNGYMTEEALATIEPYLDAANVDLKSFRDSFYRDICKGTLQPVLDTIERMHERGIWVEVTTLVVPDQNDSDDELDEIASFIASVSTDIPWHISRFRPDYEYDSSGPTPIETLERALAIGHDNGLKYVYLGNIVGERGTKCPNCGHEVISRSFMSSPSLDLDEGECTRCATPIAGVFSLEEDEG